MTWLAPKELHTHTHPPRATHTQTHTYTRCQTRVRLFFAVFTRVNIHRCIIVSSVGVAKPGTAAVQESMIRKNLFYFAQSRRNICLSAFHNMDERRVRERLFIPVHCWSFNCDPHDRSRQMNRAIQLKAAFFHLGI